MDIVQVFQCLQSSFFHSGHSSPKQNTREQQLSTRWKLMSGPIMYDKNPVASYILFIILAFLISWDFHKAHIQVIPLCNIWPLSLILGCVSSQLLELKFKFFQLVVSKTHYIIPLISGYKDQHLLWAWRFNYCSYSPSFSVWRWGWIRLWNRNLWGIHQWSTWCNKVCSTSSLQREASLVPWQHPSTQLLWYLSFWEAHPTVQLLKFDY